MYKLAESVRELYPDVKDDYLFELEVCTFNRARRVSLSRSALQSRLLLTGTGGCKEARDCIATPSRLSSSSFPSSSHYPSSLYRVHASHPHSSKVRE